MRSEAPNGPRGLAGICSEAHMYDKSHPVLKFLYLKSRGLQSLQLRKMEKPDHKQTQFRSIFDNRSSTTEDATSGFRITPKTAFAALSKSWLRGAAGIAPRPDLARDAAIWLLAMRYQAASSNGVARPRRSWRSAQKASQLPSLSTWRRIVGPY